MTMQGSAPAGWYPAPHADDQLRYWDGSRWRDIPPPRAANPAVDAPDQAPRRSGLRWWGWVLIAVGVVTVVGVVAAGVFGIRLLGETQSAQPAPSGQTQSPAAFDRSPFGDPAVLGRQVLKGVGDAVIDIDLRDPAIVTFQTDSDGYVSVGADNEGDGFLVSTAGPYRGTVLVDETGDDPITQFSIEADEEAAWTMILDDPATAPRFAGEAGGSGDAVFWMTGSFSAARFTNDGDSNFIVQGWSQGMTFQSLLNEIGTFDDTVDMVGPALVELQSNGHWTVAPH